MDCRLHFSSTRRGLLAIGIMLVLVSFTMIVMGQNATPIFAQNGIAQDDRPTPLPNTPCPPTATPPPTETPPPTSPPATPPPETHPPAPTATPTPTLLPTTGSARIPGLGLLALGLLIFGLGWVLMRRETPI